MALSPDTQLLHGWTCSSLDETVEAVYKEHTFSTFLSLQMMFWGLSVATEVC